MRSRSPLLARAGRAARIWWDAVSSGRFFTGWTVLVALFVVLVVLPPFNDARDLGGFVLAQSVSLLSAALFFALMAPVAWAERRLRHRAARGVLVIASLVALSTARPLVNDLLAWQIAGLPVAGGWTARIATNAAVWFVLLSLVAVASVRYARSRESTRRLAAALRVLDEGRAQASRYRRESSLLRVALVADLRAGVDRLLAQHLDFDRVRAFSDEVRAASHALHDQAGLELRRVRPETGPSSVPALRSTSPFARLRPPAPLFVGVLFLVGSAPFFFVSGGVGLVLVGAAVVLPATFAADVVTRRIGRRRPHAERGVLLVAVWVGVGALLTAVGLVVLPDAGPVSYIPVAALPVLAVICAVCAHALHRSTTQSRRLGRVLRESAEGAASVARKTREPLTAAADLLHGRVQGRCVMLAAHVDEDEATDADIETFRVGVEAAFAEVLAVDASEPAVAHDDIDEIISMWRRVLDVSYELAPDAASPLANPPIARRVAAVIGEGLVNAVKHASGRTVTVAIDLDDAALRVRVTTVGELDAVAETSGRGVAALGDGVSLFEHDGRVVLEARIDADADVAAGAGPRR